MGSLLGGVDCASTEKPACVINIAGIVNLAKAAELGGRHNGC